MARVIDATFYEGSPVRLVGMHDTSLNGAEGAVVGRKDSKTGRWGVSVLIGGIPCILAVKSGNMATCAEEIAMSLADGNPDRDRVLAQRGVVAGNICRHETCTNPGKKLCSGCSVVKCKAPARRHRLSNRWPALPSPLAP